MTAKILCVDDEPNILEGLQRNLFEHFDVYTAQSGAEALQLLENETFEVIISDMRMPEMDGAELLKRVRKLAPNMTRILLTGHADVNSAMSAINDGHIFRFLLKPCPTENLIEHIEEAVKLCRLKKTEKDLLENTLKAAVRVLTDILSMAAPEALRRSVYIRRLVAHMAVSNELKGRWEFDIAAMLSQLGAVALPASVLQKAFSSVKLDEQERKMMQAIPASGAKLVHSIPRLERVAMMIESQYGTDDDMSSLPVRVQAGARMLRIANWIDKTCLLFSISVHEAIKKSAIEFPAAEDQLYLDSLSTFVVKEDSRVVREIYANELKIGMLLEEDLLSPTGGVVLSKGQEMTSFLIDRLINFSRGSGLQEPFKVLC
jgi:response regulator RpfG family c-di-GMP phosphodiesterase